MLAGPQGQAECYRLPAFTALPYNDCYFKYVVLSIKKKNRRQTKNMCIIQCNKGRKAILKKPRWWSYFIAGDSAVLGKFCFTSSAEKNQQQHRKQSPNASAITSQISSFLTEEYKSVCLTFCKSFPGKSFDSSVYVLSPFQKKYYLPLLLVAAL